MKRYIMSTVVICLALLLAGYLPARAQWVHNGIPVYLSGPSYAVDTSPFNVSIIDDGSGGAIVIWKGASDSMHVVQAIGSDGSIRWDSNGKPISQVYELQGSPKIMSDGGGGAFVVWSDTRNYFDLNDAYDLFAQRIDENGDPLWSSSDLPICVSGGSGGNESVLALVSDGSGGVIIIFSTGVGGEIYAQRVDSGGNALWTTNGIHVDSPTYFTIGLCAVSDGVGGAIIAWDEYQDLIEAQYVNLDIFAKRIDSDGNVLWGSSGIPISQAAEHQYVEAIAPGAYGSAIIGWRDYRGFTIDIYAQRIDTSGVVQWTTDGKPVCTASGYERDLGMVSDGSGGAILTWTDPRSGDDIYAQRINSDGNGQWTANGEPVCALSNIQKGPVITTDGSGGAVISWYDRRSGEYDIYAQRLNYDGNAQWVANGMVICDAVYDQDYPVIVFDGSGGAVVAWVDDRNFYIGGLPEEWYLYSDLFAQAISGDGIPGYPCPIIFDAEDIPDDQGGSISVIWDASALDASPYQLITHYSLWRLLSGPEASAILDDSRRASGLASNGIPVDEPDYRIIELGASASIWEWITNVPARYAEQYAYTVPSLYDSMGSDPHWQYFVVTAQTEDPFTYWDSPVDSGYSVDNLSPAPPSGLMAEQSFVPEGLSITWDPNAESDLQLYNVYRGLTEDFATDLSSLIASPSDASYFDDEWRWDSGFYYKVSAKDVHGNESDYSSFGSDDITGEDPPATPTATYLGQNFPNPFNPNTTIAFGLKARTAVSLKIYDASGSLVRVLVNEALPAGHYTRIWDGKDTGGKNVTSGIYFYRFVTHNHVESKKMIMLR